MKTRVKKKWIETLRSGKLRQARGVLQTSTDKTCVCALGALGVLYNEENPEHSHDLVACSELPATVRKWAGLSRELSNYVIQLNDAQKNTFEQIADELESLDGE